MTENLALAFQEVFTAIERLRANRQPVSDAETFRLHMREALNAAEQRARQSGYSPKDTDLAKFAVVGFLDQSILSANNPVFGDWPRRTLQHELFTVHNAGDIFFQNVDLLLKQSDSPALADVLEVYQLCLLLGFGGRYSVGGRSELRSYRDSIAERIRRIRGVSPELSPSWAPAPGGVARSRSDPWVKRLLFAALGCLALALVLFLVYKLMLGSEVSTVAHGSSLVGTLAYARGSEPRNSLPSRDREGASCHRKLS